MATIWDTLWAASGDKIVVPEPAQAGGEVSVTQGWTPDYELPDTDPDYKPVGREEMNGALNMITESIQQLQKQGAAEWSANLAPYMKGAEVIHGGERWYNPVAGNSTEPGTGGATWIIAGSVPDASTTVKGIVELATIVEARAGDTTRALTGETGQALAIGWGQTWQTFGLGSRTTGVTYTNSTGKPIMVMIGQVNTLTFSVIINGVSVYSYTNSNNVTACVFIVPNGGTYSLTGGTISSWAELR